jgi:hypothetical protein
MMMRRYRAVDPEAAIAHDLVGKVTELEAMVASLSSHAKGQVRSRVKQ